MKNFLMRLRYLYNMKIKYRKNLCKSCAHTFPTCDSGKIKFASHINDGIVRCENYTRVKKQEDKSILMQVNDMDNIKG